MYGMDSIATEATHATATKLPKLLKLCSPEANLLVDGLFSLWLGMPVGIGSKNNITIRKCKLLYTFRIGRVFRQKIDSS